MISLSKTDFEGIVRGHDMWISKGKRWESIIPLWGFTSFLIENHNDTQWVCFDSDARDIPMAPFCQGVSGLRPTVCGKNFHP